MNLSSIFFTSLLVGLSGAAMPGPLLSVNIYGTLRSGIKGGLSTIVGHSLVEAVILIILLIGLKKFLSYQITQGIIGILGGGVLIWMGINMLRSIKTMSLELETTSLSKDKHYMLHGVLASISNPYWYLWWATIGLNYLSIARQNGVYGPPAFYFGHISADFVWYGIITFLISKGVRKINQKVYRLVIFVLGIFLIFMGIYFITFGINKI